MVESIDLQVAYGAVKHFGRNLYTSNPPAIAELVANSWDAYATQCEIINNNDELFIIDNGIGMTDDELSEKYAVSGYEKETTDIRVPDGQDQRPYMGRKGIGKFSAFSLGDEYVLYTKSNSDQKWKFVKFRYSDLLVNEPIVRLDVGHIENLSESFGDIDSEIFNDFKTGTVIHIPKLKRKFIKTTENNLMNILSRRFSVNISNKYDFTLKINSNKVDLEEHFYDKYVEFLYYFNIEENEIRQRFPSIEENYIKKVADNDFINNNGVKGWIGSVLEPKNLKIENEYNSGGVVIYINGKLADENILSPIQNARISNNYIVGEVDADFLQNEDEDPVLSSREGLNQEFENVANLRHELSSIRNELVNDWNQLRASRDSEKQDYLIPILKDETNKRIYEQVFSTEQRKRFNTLVQKVFDNNEEKTNADYKYYTPILISVVNSEIINKITIDDEDELGTIISKIYDLFDKVHINNALRVHSHIEDRLKIIDQLSKNIDEEAVEKVFEKHLYDNPWLINPFYDRASKDTIVENQKYFEANIDGESRVGYADLIINTADNDLPIVVELKREKKTNYSAPPADEIINQIKKYRTAILQKARNENSKVYSSNLEDIEAYFICGKEALAKLEDYERNDIEHTNKIVIKTYDALISQARSMYKDVLEEDILWNSSQLADS
ncbi:hypothetical protein AWM75_07930 [Aerococcus urinaehominis]|uniref:Uncharacterized protein n=1 Tax=Aerococcus urinaehominis TaxID=128944 RepID=A0A0X8FM79_9LACT|nr:ATP-binding protein [Aerococcus urinaehominis]AMB99901.1 hypothetical protein AWM75_07930 [Aerococcus urinaehominis]SDM52471.1 PD-(D/E)XK nuclease superfamily protein [Aerococcus urinaehominis]